MPSPEPSSAARTASTGLSIAELIDRPALAGSTLSSGRRPPPGRIHRVLTAQPGSAAEPDSETLVIAPPALVEIPEPELVRWLGGLADRGVAGLAVVHPDGHTFPPALLAPARRRGLSILHVPARVGFDLLLNEVIAAILARQAAVVEEIESEHRLVMTTVLSGGGLDEICTTAASVLETPVVAVDEDRRVLSASDPAVAGQGVWLAVLAASLPTREIVAREDGSVLVAVPIRAGSEHHGLLIAHQPSGELRADAVSILERAANASALAIAQRRATSAVDNQFQSDVIRDLVEGRHDRLDRVLDQCGWFGWDLTGPLYVVVTVLDQVDTQTPRTRSEDLDRLLAAWRRALNTQIRGAACVVVSDQIVTLVPPPASGTALSALQRVNERVGRELPGRLRPVTIGLSRPVEELTSLPEAYSQSRRAATVGPSLRSGSVITAFEDLGVLRLLSLLPDSAELRSYLADVLGPLLPEDEADLADLRRTLRVLLECNLNVAEAARELHFHYNTLRYRIGKLERIVGPFMTDPAVRLDVTLALQLVEVHRLAVR